MNQALTEFVTVLEHSPPYDHLPDSVRSEVAGFMRRIDAKAGEQIYSLGDRLEGLYLLAEGQVEVHAETGALVSVLGPGQSFGERGLMRDGLAVTDAMTSDGATLFLLPTATFHALIAEHPSVERFFTRPIRSAGAAVQALTATPISELMIRDPLTCRAGDTIASVAAMMRDRAVSCILVTKKGTLKGIVTSGDLTNRALAESLPADTPVRDVMTPDPISLQPDALGADVLHAMLERGIGHLPVVEGGLVTGILTQTDLTRYQATSSANLIREIVKCSSAKGLAQVVGRIPNLLVNLVGSGSPHEATARLITEIGDAVTRRLLTLAEAALGPAPVPYLWLACGSQGRQEQTGVSDQDNCLFIADDMKPKHDAYFEALARFVSDGLNTCGYYYCPGDMMATNPRWRQPVRVWRDYFAGWVREPDPMAQMLASVMFDLRPISGDESLFHNLQAETLERASANSIFVAHMVSNSLKHTPPLSLLRGFATIRSGEHKDTLDLKLKGVVPIVDLGRVYALQGRLGMVNTLARLKAAVAEGIISGSGGHDLIDAYDLIAETRLRHQAERVRSGEKPDNFMMPASLSDLERSHLRDAFVVVKTMQSALGQGLGTLT